MLLPFLVPRGAHNYYYCSSPMYWLLLFFAGLLEVVWAVGLKSLNGGWQLVPLFVTVGGALGSFALLALAMRNLPLGTAYAVWTGIGAVGTFAFGVVFLGEPLTLARTISVMLIVAGLVGLKLASS
jgi:quaternary ammonium compound-resistance protein SugE